MVAWASVCVEDCPFSLICITFLQKILGEVTDLPLVCLIFTAAKHSDRHAAALSRGFAIVWSIQYNLPLSIPASPRPFLLWNQTSVARGAGGNWIICASDDMTDKWSEQNAERIETVLCFYELVLGLIILILVLEENLIAERFDHTLFKPKRLSATGMSLTKRLLFFFTHLSTRAKKRVHRQGVI